MKSNAKSFFIGGGVTLLFGLIIFYFTFGFPSTSEFDIPTSENKKIIAMFDEQLEKSISNHTKSSFYPGYLETSHIRARNFLNSITKLESYSRYGVTSSRPHNAIEMKIFFKNGTKVEKVYTGLSSSHVMPPPLLLSITLKDGKTQKVLTNGVEKKGSPEWIINDLSTLIDAAISYDQEINHDLYFPSVKTQKDFDKEWDEK